MHLRQVVGAKRVLLDRDEMQAFWALRIRPPRVPGGEKIQTETEAGLDDDKGLMAAPPQRQAVAAEKDVARLLQPASGRVIDIAERRRIGRALAVEGEARGLDG